MQVVVQTVLNPPMVVYDSAVPSSGQGLLSSLLQPVVAVEQGGIPLYATGQFYPDNSTLYIIGLLVLLGAVGYGIYQLTR